VLGGRYRLITSLGSGATAEVWRARDTRLARDVAVKIFDELRVLPGGADRRMIEMRLLAGVAGPGIVTIYDAQSPIDSAGDLSFLVMELVDGQTLADRLREEPLPAATAADIGAQLAETLAHVHERRVVHRDIKPANILLARSDGGLCVKLTDFGIARLLDDSGLTAEGLTLGTANYLSPEQATGGEVGPACDVYALGLVLIECLTGVKAYPGHGIEAAIARLHRPPHLPDRMPAPWRELLSSMTAYAPQDRPATTEVARALRGLHAELSDLAADDEVPMAAVPGTTAPLPVQLRTGRHRRRALWLGASAAAAGLAALLVVASTNGQSPAAPQVSTPSGEGVPADADADSGQPARVSPSTTREGAAASTVATSTSTRAPAAVSVVRTAGARTVTRAASSQQKKKKGRTPAKPGGPPAGHPAPPHGKKKP
jgi:hypothetical protein